MATLWIKIEHTTPDKPEVVQMAAALRMDQDAVVGKLVRLLVWADQNSVDGSAMGITRAFVDRLTNKRGFAAALEGVAWLSGADGALSLTNFSRHNGETAKARAQSNRRVAELRERANGNGDDGHEVTVVALPKAGDVTRGALQKPLPDEDEDEDGGRRKKTKTRAPAPESESDWKNRLAGEWPGIDIAGEIARAQAKRARSGKVVERKWFERFWLPQCSQVVGTVAAKRAEVEAEPAGWRELLKDSQYGPGGLFPCGEWSAVPKEARRFVLETLERRKS